MRVLKRCGGHAGIGLFAVLSVLAAQGQGVPPGSTTLAALRDRARVLLIFSATATDARLEAQLQSVRGDAAGAAERDLIAIAVPERGGEATDVRLADSAAARRRFHLRPGEFRVILVGKDGGEKLRSREPIPFDRLRDTIDAMPMRQEEMKARTH